MGSTKFPLDLPLDRLYDVVGLGGNAIDHLARIPRHPSPGEKVKFTEYSRQGGGRTATAMVTIARLGRRARYMGGLGDDPEGEIILDGLRAEGVDTAGCCVRRGGLTQRAFILVEEGSGERTIVWGRSEGMPLEANEVDRSIVSSARIFYTDAQNPLASAPAARAAKEMGMPVIADLEATRAGFDELLPMIDVAITGAGFPRLATGSTDLAEGMRILEERSRGAWIVVTQGAAGAVARIDGRVERFPGYRVEVVDTTGAGDVFHGAFVIGCLQGMELRETIDFSNAVAAMKCRALGGREAIPRSLEEVDRFRREATRRAPAG